MKLSIEEAIRSIELGKRSAIGIYCYNKNYSYFYLEKIIKDCEDNLLRINKKTIKEMINDFSRLFRIISYEDKIKLAMESKIEDISKNRYLMKLCKEELIRRKILTL